MHRMYIEIYINLEDLQERLKDSKIKSGKVYIPIKAPGGLSGEVWLRETSQDK